MNSEINGTGYGSTHSWISFTPQDNSKQTLYNCSICGAKFIHHYDSVPYIFEAIKSSGVVNVCPNLKEAAS